MITKSKGFTLLEILVASVILFSSVVAVSLVYRTSYIASQKATFKVEQAGIIKTLLANIQLDIRQRTTQNSSHLEGQGKIWDQKYSWQANLFSLKAPPDKFDIDLGKIESYPDRYKLWSVSLILGEGSSERVFEYYELSWF